MNVTQLSVSTTPAVADCGSGRFTLTSTPVFNGWLVRLFDNQENLHLKTWQVGKNGQAWDGHRINPDVCSAVDAFIARYLADERRRQEVAERMLARFA